MVPQGSKIQSIISVAGHQVIRNLSEPSEFILMHLDTYADYLRQVEPRTDSRAVRALQTTGGPRMKKLHGRYLEVYGPYQVMLNVDGISIYTRTYVTTDDDQMGQIYLGEEELKVRRIGHDAMMEQDAVHIGYEADVTAHLLDTNGTKIGVTGLLMELMMDPACEVNEKGTREKNDGNEVVEEGTDTPLDLDPNEVIEADDETLPYAEEDWQDPEQIEVPKNLEPDLPFTIQTRQKDGTRPRKKYNPYGDDFVVD